VAIELDLQKPTPCVVLHAAHMNVTAVTLLGAGMQDGVPGMPGSRFTWHVMDECIDSCPRMHGRTSKAACGLVTAKPLHHRL